MVERVVRRPPGFRASFIQFSRTLLGERLAFLLGRSFASVPGVGTTSGIVGVGVFRKKEAMHTQTDLQNSRFMSISLLPRPPYGRKPVHRAPVG